MNSDFQYAVGICLYPAANILYLPIPATVKPSVKGY